jgi:predicted ester cyclase
MNTDLRDRHRQIVTQIFERAWNQADFDGLEDLIAAEARFQIRRHTLPTNVQDLQRIVTAWHQAFPDFRFAIEDMVAQGEQAWEIADWRERVAALVQEAPAAGSGVSRIPVLSDC